MLKQERFSLDILSSISNIVVAHSFEKAIETPAIAVAPAKNEIGNNSHPPSPISTSGDVAQKQTASGEAVKEKTAVITNKLKLLMDATVPHKILTTSQS